MNEMMFLGCRRHTKNNDPMVVEIKERIKERIKEQIKERIKEQNERNNPH
jgi:hypothetical protein